MSLSNKQYLYKVYDSTGVYITTWNDVASVPQFTTIINGGADVMTIKLARGVLSFGEADDVAFNNRIDVYVVDQDAPTGALIFSGYISQYTPTLDGAQEFVEVQIFSYFAELNRFMYEDVSENTTITHSSVDPTAIFQDVFDELTRQGGLPDYDGSSTDLTGTVVSYEFNTATCKEAVDKVLELCPDGWYYRIDPDNIAYLREVSTTADHIFTIGRDIALIEPQKRIQGMINKVYFVGADTGSGDNLYYKYTRSSSISTYGHYAKKYVDNRVTNNSTAETLSNRVLDQAEVPEIRTRVIVIDNNGSEDGFGYDIESIKVGQTARVLGFSQTDYTRWDEASWDVDVWDFDITNVTATVQQIQRIEYNTDHIVLELSNRLPDINKRIEDISRNLEATYTADNPSSPS